MSELVKICVTVPKDEADSLRETIGKAGGGKVGNYTFCSFSVIGVGRFKPENGANPSIGTVGNLESVEEERIEITCIREKAKQVVEAIRQAHSYEEPVVDIYPLISM